MYAGGDAALKELLLSCKKQWNLKLIKFAPLPEEEQQKKREEEYKNSSWAGKLFKAIASVTLAPPPPHNPPEVEVLMPFVRWEVVWKQFERELVKNEEAEAAAKLSRELLATKVKDVRILPFSYYSQLTYIKYQVKINMTVQVNKWLVFMPTAIVSYTYGNSLYKVSYNLALLRCGYVLMQCCIDCREWTNGRSGRGKTRLWHRQDRRAR